MSGPYYVPGRYWGRVVNQQLGKSSNNNPQIVITFLVMGKVNLEDPQGNLLPCGENFERSIFRSITDKTAEWAAQDLEKLGFESTSFGDVDLNSSNASDMRGHEAAFFCEHEEYPVKSGKIRERWRLASEGSLVVKALDAKEVRQLDAMFGKYLKGKSPVAAAPTIPKTQPRNAKPVPAATQAADPNAALDEAAKDGVPF